METQGGHFLSIFLNFQEAVTWK